jgi:integrase
MKAKSKLYQVTDVDFELPVYVDMRRKVNTRDASNIPMITWPDGSWCLPANVYMLSLFQRGLSRRNRGGTLLTYATNISHLLRFLFDNQIDLVNFTDNQFSFFIKTLQGERRANKPEVLARDSNSVIAIGRNCLDFLSVMESFYKIENYLGPTCQIRATQKEFTLKQRGSKKLQAKMIRKFWHHSSFPTPSPKNKRLPISTVNVEKIRQIINTESKSIFQRKRRYVMLKLLEITGGRRSEVAAVSCENIYKATKTNMLQMITVKKGGGIDEIREIPISNHDLAFLIEFIEKNRRSIIRSTCGLENDDDFLLISQTSGRGLRSNTITQEIASLSKAAGIMEKSCPHMFRHRFITKLFVALIEQHEFENPDSFRKALLDTEKIKQIVQQWTGHSDLNSLDVYINLAFDEITNFKGTFDIVYTHNILQSAKGTLKQLKTDLKSGDSLDDISDTLHKLLEGLERDLNKPIK